MPVYRHNGDVYDIPQDKAREFESQFPEATVEVYSGNDVYDIPVGVQEEFFSRYSDASYSAPSAPSAPSAEEIAEEMRPNDESRFGILGKMGQYMGSPSAYVPMPQAEEREPLTQAEIDERAAMRKMLQDSGTIDRMEEMEKEARKNKFKAFGEALAYTPQVSSFGVSSNIYKDTEEQFADAQRAMDASAEHRQNKAMEQTLDVALDKARAGEWGGIGENNVGNGVVDFGLGLWDSATRMSTWDFGVSDTLNGLTIAQVVKKWEENPESLTATERNLLDAMGMATAVQEAYQDQVGIGYAVGESLPVSAGFMASMYLNPASGLGKSLARQAVKKYGRQSIAKNLARIGGDIAETAIMTATTGGGRVVADALDRINGQSTYEIDPETGIVMYGGQEDQKTVGEAVVKAIGSNFIENYSEALGEYFDPLLGMSRRLAAGGLRKMNLDKWADALSDVEPSQMAASIRSLREKAKFGGVFGEIMEEEVGMALNAITVGDYTFSKEEADASNGKKQWIFDLENQLTTALSCAIMSGALTGVETIGNVRYRREMERGVADAEKAARAAVGDEMIAQIDQASPEGMVDILRDAYMDQNLTLQQKRVLAEYATQRVRMQYYNAADAKARRQVNVTQQNTIDAYEAGRHAQLPQYYNIDQEYRRSEAAINERENAEEIWDAIRLMNNMDENERQNIMRDFSEEDQELIRNWRYNAYRWQGAINHRAEQVEDLVDEYAGQVNPYVVEDEQGNRNVTTAVYGDNVVYVMAQNADGATTIVTNDGRKKMVNANELEHVQTHNADELIELFRQKATEVVSQETEKSLSYPSEVQEPAQGVIVETLDGKQWQVVATDGENVQLAQMAFDKKNGQWVPSEASRTMTREQFMDWQKAELDRKKDNTYEQGDELTFYVNGEPISAEITGITPDGDYNVQISHLSDGLDKSVSDVYTAEELRKLTTPSSKVSEKTTENESTPTEEIKQSVREEVANSQIEDNMTEPAAEVVESVNTALSRVPKDAKGNPLYEQTDADTAWDAIMEQTEGDAEMAQRIAEEMVADKKAALTKMQKGKPKKGSTVAEKIANEKAHIAAIAQAEQEVTAWEKIAQVNAIRNQSAELERAEAEKAAAEQRKAEEARILAEQEEQARIEREALNGVPDMVDDVPADARARGYRRVNGHKVDRQGVLPSLQGKEVGVKFANDMIANGRVAVIEAETLQPSHLQGQRNPAHFIDEAQPKERNDEASIASARKIASNIRPEEITSSVTAYTGAPTVNMRGEAIQGNSRSDALRVMWAEHPDQAEMYKQYLIDHAEEFGLNAEEIAAMQHPVLVNMLDVSDTDAINLGQYVAQDTESGGTERIKPKNVARKMGKDIRSFANILLNSSEEEMSFAELVDKNGIEVLKWMNTKGYITPTQYASAFDSKGNLTAEAKNDLRGILYQSIFQGGNTQLEEQFNALPAKAQKAILATAYRDYDSPETERIVDEIQSSIRAYYALSHDRAFVDAKNYKEAKEAMLVWSRQYQMDDVTGESFLPSENFSNFALELAVVYKGWTQTNIQSHFNNVYDLVQGTKEASLFEEADNAPRTLADAIKETFNIEYNGQLNSNSLAVNREDDQAVERGSDGDTASGERAESGEGSADSGRGTDAAREQGEVGGKRKVTANYFEMAEEAQKKLKEKKNVRNIQEEEKGEVEGERGNRPRLGNVPFREFAKHVQRHLEKGYSGVAPTEEVARIIREHNKGKSLLAHNANEQELLKALRVMTNEDIDGLLNEIQDVLQSGEITDAEERKTYEDAVALIDRFKKRGERKAIVRALTGANLGEKLPLSKIDELFKMYNSDADVSELYRRVRAIAEKIGLDFWFEEGMGNQLGGYLHMDNRVRLNAHMLYSPYVSQQAKASNILHEMLHAVVGYAVKTQQDVKIGLTPVVKLSKQVLNAANTIAKIYEKAVKGNPLLVHQEYDIEKEEWIEVADYGTTSVEEMLVEISNPEFRDKLKQIEYNGRSVWQRIWDAIKSMFTQSSDVTNPTAYDSMAKALDVLINEFSVDAYRKYSGLGEDALFIGQRGAESLDRYEEATTRLDNLNVAREMEAAEKDAKTIKMATGWERGADGKWRYEVEDNITFDREGNVRFAKRHPKVYEEYKRYKELLHKRNALLVDGGELSAAELDEYDELGAVYGGGIRLHNNTMLEDYVDDAALFEAYPKLRETRFEWTDNPAIKGQYDSVHNILRLNGKFSEEEMKRTLVHEIQHAIQGVEGFATGTNPIDAELYLKKDLPEEHEKAYEIVNRYGFTLEEARQWIKNPSAALIYEDEPLKALIADVDAGKVNWDDVEKWSISGYNAYQRAQGEVEARNAASRLGMTLEERRASLASETEDVAREDQIFLRNAVESAMAEEQDIDGINERFNNRLLELNENRDQKGRVLYLGRPSQFLRDGGVVNGDIEMDFDKFVKKSSANYENSHPFEAEDILNLPKAIYSPIAVFNGSVGSDKVILTEIKKDSNSFIVAIRAIPRTKKGGIVLEVNQITTLFPKDAKGILYWINTGKATNIDKEKALNWLEALRNHRGTKLSSQELLDAAKVVERFDNPKYSSRNILFRDGNNDAAYLAAVERGDMETAQRMVNEAARKAMKKTKVVDKDKQPMLMSHHTDAEGFYVFDRGKIGTGQGQAFLGAGFNFSRGSGSSVYGSRNIQAYLDARKPLRSDRNTLSIYQIEQIIKELNAISGDNIEYNFADNISRAARAISEYGGDLDTYASLCTAYSGETRDVLEVFEKLGFDSTIEYGDDKRIMNAVVFNSRQIKSADPVTYDDNGNVIPLSRRFNLEEEDIRFRDGAPFFSNAERAVENIKQNKATPEQWLAMIKKDGGLKAGEDKWMGLSDWLNEQKEKGVKTLTKDEVLQFIRENQIEIEEVEYGDIENNSRFKELNDEYRELYYEYDHNGDAAFEEMVSRYGDDFDLAFSHSGDELLVEDTFGSEAAEYFLGVRSIDATRRGYTTDGLDNKQEIALVVPTIDSWNRSDIIHFGDAGEGRAVAWVRFGETIDEDGKRVLVIDEVQSKRHDEGRANGYRNPRLTKLSRRIGELGEMMYGVGLSEDLHKELQSLKEERDNLIISGSPSLTALDNEITEKNARAEELKKQIDSEDSEALREELYEVSRDAYLLSNRLSDGMNDAYRAHVAAIPDAPFDKNYHELVMKRMLRYAAENGFDKVAWNTGKQVAQRFGINKVVDTIECDKVGKNGAKSYTLKGLDYKVVVNQEGTVVAGQQDFVGKMLSDVVGKPIADKMIQLNEGESIDNAGLTIGGEDRNALYDEMIPRFMNKYTKKWGTKVDEVTLPEVEEAGRTMWSVDVTPEMRESVMQGQPMFREGMGAVSDREVSYENDPIAKWQGKPRYYGKRASAFAERERARMQKGVEEAAKILGLEVEIVTDASTLKGRKAKAKGWYDINSKKVVVVIPNHVSKGDAVRTVLHEGVAHHGLRGLFGDGFDAMLDNIYNNVAPELKACIDAIAERTGVSTSVATEEYLASLAEDTNFEYAKRTGWWTKIKGYFMKMLNKLGMPGLNLKEELTDNELRYLLWRSYQNLVDPNSYMKPLGYIDDVAKQKELKVGNYAENTMATPRAAEPNSGYTSEEEIIAKAKADGTYMKAPNGKPSNLTPEQWVRVRTKNFIRWFGDWINDPQNASKVVDENGEPMVVYHSSNHEFTRFDPERIGTTNDLGFYGRGFYFTPNEQYSKTYGEVSYPVFLNIREPFMATDMNSSWASLLYNREDDSLESMVDEDVVAQYKEQLEGADGVIHNGPAYFRGGEPIFEIVASKPNQIKSATENNGEYSDENDDIRYRLVEDQAEIDRLESEPTIKAYRAMQVINGELYPPMSAVVDGKLREPIALGQWERSEEQPELADDDGYFKLNKGNKKSPVPARYNPYFHSSATPLNDQFAEAQDRPNLVTVEVEIPQSEADGTSGYKAEKAKDAVGAHQWKAGAIQGQISGTRTLYLSRWDKPVRIVPDSEVAGVIAKMLEGTGIVMPSNVVTPSLRAELEKLGVPFVETTNKGVIAEGEHKGEGYGKVYGKKSSKKSKKKAEITAEVERESAALGVPVRIVRSVDELPDEGARKRAVDGQLKGYFDPRTGEVALYEPNTDDANDAKRTVLHEIVGHRGLRQLIGEERYDKAMVQLMYMLPSEVRDTVLRRAERHGWNAAIAMDEYLAEQAERDVQPTWWGKVNAKIRAILRNIGFNVKLTDADVTYLLWRSRKKLMGDTAFDMATNAILKQAARKSAKADAWNEQAFKDAEMRDFERGAMQRLRNRIGDAQNEYDSAMKSMAFKQRESWQDSMRSLKVFMDIVSKESGKKIADWENAYMYENAMSSANLMEMQMFRHDVYGRLLKAVHELMESGAKYEEIVDYMMAKHGLERNEKMARAEAEEKVERWKEKAVEEMQAKAVEELEKQNQRNAVIEAGAKSAYKVKKQRLKGQLERGTISEAQYDHYMQMAEQAYQNELATMKTTHPVDVIAEIEKINTKAEQKLNEYWADHRDYSGLTALTGKDGVAGAESAAMQMIADFEAKHNTDLLWNETRACKQTILNISHDAGILSDKVYDELWNQYEYYIPLRGFDETTAEEVYTYVGDNKSPYNAPIKTAKGRKSKADDPIATIATMAESAIVEANRNRLKQRFLYMVERHRTELASVSSVWVEKDPITGDCVARFANIPNDATPEEAAQVQKAFEERMEQLHEQEPERYYKASEKPNIPYRVEKKANEHEHQIIVKRNGKDVVITINGDPRVAQAINGLTNAEAVEGFSKFAGKVNRFLSANFTTRNPAFVVSNFVRDGFYTNSMVWAKEGRAYAWKYNQNWVKATKLLPSLVSKYKRYEKGDKSALDMSDPVERAFYEFMINGGETGYTVINSVEDYKGLVAGDLKTMQGGVVGNTKKAVQSVGEVLDTFGRWAEDTSRFAAFLTSREMGRSVTKSIWDAKEISVNFNKKGSGRKMTQHDKGLNSILGWMSQQGRNLYVFWNAGMQGLHNFGKAVKEHPGKMAGLTGVYFGLGMAIAAIFGGHDDDEDYWNLPEYVRRNNICFRVGNKFVTLPLPIELRAIYGMGELAMSWMAGKEDPKKVGMKVVQQMSQVMPIDMMAEGGGLMAFVPSWGKPIVEVRVNTDWTGMPIYRKRTSWNEYDPQWMLAFKSTSPELVAASRAINEATNKNLQSGKENKYDRGWADIEYLNNPAAWEHVVEGYLGGLATMFNQTKKSTMAIWNKDLREVRNIPVVSRFLKDAGEKSEEYALREDYFNAKGVVDELRSQRGHFRKESIDPSLTEEQRKDVMESRIEMEEMVNATISQWNSLENARKRLEDMVNDNPDQEVTFDGKKGNAKDALDEVTRRMVKLTEGYQ